MSHATSLSLRGPSVDWLVALPRGQVGPYLNHIILTSQRTDAPVCMDGPARRFSVLITDEALACLDGAPNRSVAVQGLIEARIRAVEDAKMYRANERKYDPEDRAGSRWMVLGEEAAFGRNLGRIEP